MHQVKIFKGVETDVRALEEEVNTWIRQSGASVVGFAGNIAPQSASAGSQTGGLGKGAFAPSDVILILLYEAG